MQEDLDSLPIYLPDQSCQEPHPLLLLEQIDGQTPLIDRVYFDEEVEQGIFHHSRSPSSNSSKGRRDSNTIFKTSLSASRKVAYLRLQAMLSVIGRDPEYAWVLKDITAMSSTKNNSLFPRYVILVRELGLQTAFLARWRQIIDAILTKKRQYVKESRYSQKRLDLLLKMVEREEACFKEPDLEEAIRLYWGQFRQSAKFLKSKEEVLKYLSQVRGKIAQLRQGLQPPRQPKRSRKGKGRRSAEGRLQ